MDSYPVPSHHQNLYRKLQQAEQSVLDYGQDLESQDVEQIDVSMKSTRNVISW